VRIDETFMVVSYQVDEQAVVPKMIVTAILTKLQMKEDWRN
jgi:hypothetical protein